MDLSFSSPVNIIGQIIGFMAMAGAIICFQQKDRSHILGWQILVTTLWTVHFILLGFAGSESAITGAAINASQLVRSMIFFRKGKDKWADWNGWLVVFIIVTIVIGIATWENPLSILPVIGTIFSTVSLWMKKPLTIRVLTFPVSVTWGIYDAFTKSIAGVCNESFCIISLIIAIIRIDIPKLKADKEAAKEKETANEVNS